MIHRRLEEVFRTVFEDPEFELSSDATADTIAGWDSLAHIILMVAIEQEFGVRFRGNELAEMRDVGELEDFLGHADIRQMSRLARTAVNCAWFGSRQGQCVLGISRRPGRLSHLSYDQALPVVVARDRDGGVWFLLGIVVGTDPARAFSTPISRGAVISSRKDASGKSSASR